MRVAHLARKPIAEGSVGRNVLVHGTGGLNIDATRITWHGNKPSQEEWNLKGSTGAVGANGYAGQVSAGMKQAYVEGKILVPSGRWPGNVVLVHREGCQKLGSRRIPGHKGYPNGPGGKSMHYASTARSAEVRPNAWQPPATDQDGMETVDTWACVEGCPVLELDAQSGVTRSGAMRREVTAYEGESVTGLLRGRSGPSNQHGDAGGASRFFKQVGR